MIYTIGKIIFGLYFVYNGYSHFKNVGGLTGYAQSKKVPMAKFSVLLSGLMLLLGGASILLGMQNVLGMWILVAFLLPTTFIMHDFWKETDPMAKMNQKIAFTKNMALVGALLMLIGIN